MVDGPKYLAIADALRARIDRGEFAPGDRLPSQHALADDYGVTVMTLRQALGDLERDGLVHAVRGTGTFVSQPPAVRLGLDHLGSFVREMEARGTEIVTEVLAVRFDVDDDAAVRRGLELGDGVGVAEILRRRSIDDTPVVVQRSAMAAAVWQRIASIDLSSMSLYDALAERAGLRVERASETFRAVAAGTDDAQVLDVPVGTPCLESTRVSYTATGPFLFDRALLLGSAAEVCAERTATGLRLGYRSTTDG